jgi:hypothetical protein
MIRGVLVIGDLPSRVGRLDFGPEKLLAVAASVAAVSVHDSFKPKFVLLSGHIITETYGTVRDQRESLA